MMSGRKEADVGLRDVSTLVYVTADPGVIALTGQADVAIVVVGSGAASLIELTANWWEGFSRIRRSRIRFVVMKGD